MGELGHVSLRLHRRHRRRRQGRRALTTLELPERRRQLTDRFSLGHAAVARVARMVQPQHLALGTLERVRREVVVADPRACHTNPAEELRLRARALGAALGVPGKGEARCVLLSLGQDDLVIRARLVPFLEVRLLPWLKRCGELRLDGRHPLLSDLDLNHGRPPLVAHPGRLLRLRLLGQRSRLRYSEKTALHSPKPGLHRRRRRQLRLLAHRRGTFISLGLRLRAAHRTRCRRGARRLRRRLLVGILCK